MLGPNRIFTDLVLLQAMREGFKQHRLSYIKQVCLQGRFPVIFVCPEPFNCTMTTTSLNFMPQPTRWKLKTSSWFWLERLDQLFGVLLRRSLGSFFVLQTFESCHGNNKPLLHAPNNPVKTISVILVLVDVVRTPVEWLNTFCLVAAS
jgi:hypothetical protein